MKRLMTAAATMMAILFFSAPAARADMALGEHHNGSLGFHNVDAPIGMRWWFAGQKVGLDLGLGLRSEPAPSYSDESLTGYAFEVGVPLVMRSWERAHLLFRPGILYDSQQYESTSPPDAFDTVSGTRFALTAEIEAEVFLVENVSVSASHGIGFTSYDPPGGGSSITSISTFGNNFTNIGFHVYFFGGSK